MTRTIIACAILAGATTATSAAIAAPPRNLIPNPGFEDSGAAFLTGYIKSGDLSSPGDYAIGANPNQYNSNWSAAIQPHSGGAMMIVNGATVPDTIVWDSGPIAVVPHKAYFFGAYVTSLYPVSQPVLIFRIDGVEVGRAVVTADPVGAWKQFSAVWNSGAHARADISIVDDNTDAFGNDFALDDLSLARSPFYIAAPSGIPVKFQVSKRSLF